MIELIKKTSRVVIPAPLRKRIKNSKLYVSLSKLYVSLRRRYHQMIYVHCIKRINNRIDASKPVEVAVFTFLSENWNSYSQIYSIISRREDINMTVYIFPARVFNKDVSRRYDLNLELYRETISFFERHGINFVRTYDTESEKWIDARIIKADYVLYDEPYQLYPEQFWINCMLKCAKICYIPYGFILVSNKIILNFVIPESFMRYCYAFFASWNIPADHAEQLYSLIGKKYHNVLRYGYPRFDLSVKSLSPHERFTVLWNPRFTINGENPNIPTAENTFLEFWKNILMRSYSQENEHWIIRPHPRAFSEYLQHNLITQQELEEYISDIERNPRTELDKEKDYLIAFDRSDVMLADFSSIVVEYAALGKPIIYCGNPEAIPMPEMLECMYLARSWDKAMYYLDELKKGNDPLAEKRRAFTKMIAQDGRSGERIVEYLIDDYMKSAGGHKNNA